MLLGPKLHFLINQLNLYLNISLFENALFINPILTVYLSLFYSQVIPGIESVLEYMQPGGEVTCTIPAKYAYGEKGICIEVSDMVCD